MGFFSPWKSNPMAYTSNPTVRGVGVGVCISRPVVTDSLRPLALSLPGSSVHGILQATLLEWVAIPFSSGQGRTFEIIS